MVRYFLECNGNTYSVDENTFDEIKDRYDYERCMHATGDGNDYEEITLEIDETDLPEEFIEKEEEDD